MVALARIVFRLSHAAIHIARERAGARACPNERARKRAADGHGEKLNFILKTLQLNANCMGRIEKKLILLFNIYFALSLGLFEQCTRWASARSTL